MGMVARTVRLRGQLGQSTPSGFDRWGWWLIGGAAALAVGLWWKEHQAGMKGLLGANPRRRHHGDASLKGEIAEQFWYSGKSISKIEQDLGVDIRLPIGVHREEQTGGKASSALQRAIVGGSFAVRYAHPAARIKHNPTSGPLRVEPGGPRAHYFRVRLADPKGFRARLPRSGGHFRTITLSAKKGIKAVIGATPTRGPHGGRTALQAVLFEKTKWSPARALTEARKISGRKPNKPVKQVG